MWPTVFEIPWIHLPIRGYGLMLMIGFLGGTYWATRRAVKVKANPDLVINIAFVALISSIIGARIFYVAHYWDEHFAGRGIWEVVNLTAGGMEFYGGLIGGLSVSLIYARLKKVSIRLYLDIIAPSIMFGMAMARIGCFLNGCCWGGVCTAEIPWTVQFPYASPAFARQWEDRLTTVPAELIIVTDSGRTSLIPRDWLTMSPEQRSGAAYKFRKADKKLKEAQASGADSKTLVKLRKARKMADNRRRQEVLRTLLLTRQERKFKLNPSQLEQAAHAPQRRSLTLHPAQLYASIDGLILAFLLNAYFYRRKRHGTVFGLLLLLYPLVRVIEETIRIDNPHDTAGLTISQFISLLLFTIGVVYLLKLRNMPLRSPRAIPYEPPPPPPEPKAKKN